MLNNVWASRDYIDYQLLNQKDITFADKDSSMLYIFEAKYNLDTMKLKFLQTAHICNATKAFFLTIAIPTSTIDTTNYEELLKTFTCKVESE
jgi:thiamine pyrophosphokinase